MKIEQRKISELKKYEKNARKHPEKQIELLAENIKRFGFTTPLLIDKNNEIIAGHGRLEAAKRRGMEYLPCVLIDYLSEEEIKALRLADNRLAELATWDMGLAIEELKGLDDEMVDLTGFYRDLILGVKEDEFNADDEYNKIVEPHTKEGDLYEIGEHKIICGDSTKLETFEALMGGALARICFTDPPYNVDYNYTSKYEGIRKAAKNRNKLSKQQIFNDKKKPEEFKKFLFEVFENVYKNSTDDMSLYVCHATKTQNEFFNALKDCGYHFSQSIIWLKERMILALGQDYHRIYEPIWFGWKKGKNHYKNKKITKETEVWDLDKMDFEERMDVWYLNRDKSQDYIHPTQKPVRLPERAIRKNSEFGDIVLEPFLGSGSTLIACQQLGRKCYSVELDPRFVDVVLTRWCNFVGSDKIKKNGAEIQWNTKN